ncbi:MAG TPA: hypothetical protein VL200_10960 [Lacunisphaera sp.]|jgi:hypothetical protein|nr:hypothetical protein [Lacunisphaera sp.]
MADPSLGNTTAPQFHRRWLYAGVALVLFKLWLVAGHTVLAVGFAEYDDMLFLRLAHHLLRGEWLGPYSQLTLAKGPMYSLFIAGVFLTGVPLFCAQHVLYAAACAVLVRALGPLVPRPSLRFAIFAVVLFNPVTYDAIIHTRVLRQQILHSEVLLILAALVALYARRDQPLRRLLPWSILLGTSLSAFQLTREEWIWLMPAVVPLWAAAVVPLWRSRPARWRGRLAAVLALPAVLWAAGPLLVAMNNYRHYGVFTTCEFNQRDFKDAMGALMRPRPEHPLSFVPVTREVRMKLYPLCPTFALLRGELDGPTGETWAGITESLTGLPAGRGEIGGGWFMWALRRAVDDTGHVHSGAEAAAFYRKIADEVNAACDSGKVDAGARRSGFLPPLNGENLGRFPASLWNSIHMLTTFDAMDAWPQSAGAGSPEELELIRDLTRDRYNIPRPPEHQRWLDNLRVGWLEEILVAYRRIVPITSVLGLGLAVAAVAMALARRRWTYFGLLAAGLAASCLAICGIVALIDATSFPALNAGYFTGTYALWILLTFVGPLAFLEVRSRPE